MPHSLNASHLPKQSSKEPGLSEAEVARAEGFLSDMLSVLPLVGLRVFEKLKAPTTREAVLQLSGRDADARGYESADGFVVLKGSKARASESPSIHAYMTTWRKNLLDQGVLVEEGDSFVLTQDYSFNSPSTAAGVLQGRPANGRVEWKDSEGKTLKELQEAREGA